MSANPILVACAALTLSTLAAWPQAGTVEALYDGFLDPPKEARPQVWWWFDQGAPPEAITRDLEGLARVGVSGFHVYGGDPASSAWIQRVKWALHEANRLGLDGVIMIGAAGCGHPKTDPRFAQKDLVFSAQTAKGGGTIRVTLPKASVKETPKHADGSPKYHWDIATLAVPVSNGCVSVASVRNVSSCLDRETGAFTWPDAPAGSWKILRFGYVPKVFGWSGCYIDHMSRTALDEHWNRVMQPLQDALTPDERPALKGVACDSWEAGTVSWTETFAADFRRLHGYDIVPWLPVKAGVKLETPGRAERFRRDFDETVSTLIAENHYAYHRIQARRAGLKAICEAAGPHQRQGDVRRMQGRCDVAMGEFWMPSPHRPAPPQRFMLRDAANAAHVYGLREVLAEGFTGRTHWTNHPEIMKPCVDRAFCDGLTRVCYHGMMLSSWMGAKPGRVREWGTHYNPQTTWFEQSAAFNLYLSRCGWMLSQGRAAADCLLYAGDAINVFAGMKCPSDGLGEGYDYDICPTELLLRAKVENGEVALPCGVRYKTIKFCDINPKRNDNLRPGPIAIRDFPPAAITVRENVMLKLKELVEGGATLIGGRPDGPTSMTDSSVRYHAAADVLWGPRGSAQPARRAVGRGFVLKDAAEARARIAPDVASDRPLDWIHRRLEHGDVYFLSNQTNQSVRASVRLRDVSGPCELWHPVTGERFAATTHADGSLVVDLPSCGSVFVVSSPGLHPTRNPPLFTAPRPAVLTSPWSVSFDPAWGGPAEPVVFATLTDWTRHADAGIRHYSGTAVYRTTFDAPAGSSAVLDLGEVKNVAEVVVNGENRGVVWTKPFSVAVANLKETGNTLEVRVTNLWPNRLIYDAGLPESRRLTKTNHSPYKPGAPLLPSGLLGPIRIRGTMRR